MDDELEACRAALDEIAAVCSSYKGMRPREEAPPEREPAAVEVEIEAGSAEPEEPELDMLEAESEPISLVERPADRGFGDAPRKRGRPRTRGY